MKRMIFLSVLIITTVPYTSIASMSIGAIAATARVDASCTITTTSDLRFSDYDPLSPASTDSGQGSFTFRCAKGTGYNFYISGKRVLTDGLGTVDFELYADPQKAVAWQDSGAYGVSGLLVAGDDAVKKDVFGRIRPLQKVSAGTYVGEVFATVEW